MQLTKLAPVPVLVIAASILAVLVLGVQETLVFNPPYLLLSLNLVFWTGGTAAIVYFSAKTFLQEGSVTALLISASILIFGVSVIISGWVANFSSDYSVAIGNICPLAASMVQFIGSFAWVLGRVETPNTHRKWLLIVVYTGALVFVGIISGLVLSGSLPAFFTASGPTPLRQTVVVSTIALFGLSFLSFGWEYAKSRSPTLLLYTLAIGLITIGMFSALEVMALGDVTTWLGRIALYAGTFYIVAALIESRKGSIEVSNGWAEAFRSDRHQVETIFTRMLNGFSYHKIIVDGNGKPVDYVFLAANEAFEKMTGFEPEKVIGKRVTEVLPGIEKDPADWIGAFGKVALTGQPAVIENYAQPLGKWYSVSAFSPRRGYFAAIFEDITERKKTEDKLEEYAKNLEGLVEERTRKLSSSALYTRSLIEASPDPLVTISAEGKITDVNQATELVTGFPRDQLINSDFSDYFTEPDRARVGYRRVFTDGFVKDYPLAIRHKSGRITDVLYNATVYRDEAGNVQGVFAAARDVTEHRKAEDTLRKQAALIDLSPDGTIVKKLDDTITFWSQGAERLYGWTKEEAIGQSAHILLRTNTSESLENILRRVRQTGRWSGEIIQCNKKGHKIIVQSSWLATLDRQGKIIEILESNVDVSGRKQAEDKIRAASLYSRSLIEASLDPLVTISADGKITDVNKATELATGRSMEELIGKDFSDYFTDSEKAKAGYRQVFTDGFVRDYPLAIRHKSGKITDVLYNAAVYRNEAGEIQGVFAAARDITELKKAEQQAQESARKLKDAERLATIGATAGMVGHDIRNPLQAILGDLYLAKDEIKSLRSGSTKNNLNESISAIEENIVYINKIISDLQDYTKPLNPCFEEFNLQRVVDDVLLQNKMPETIKASSKINAEVRTLKGDQAFMKRVIENLVLNAVQAMPSGGKLAVKARKETGEAVITVEDTGSGIPESVKPKLFTPLFTTKSKGQGFGLAVVKRMAEAMGGTVTFESEVGKGTKFIIRLPTPTDNRGANGFPNKSKT